MAEPYNKKLAQILRIVTSNNQYGYKENVSTVDSIVKMEQYIEQTAQRKTYYSWT